MMERLGLILVGVCCFHCVVTVPILSETSSNKLDDGNDVEVIDDTTRSLERLSSAATCLVAGIEYTHGQQISRSDPCEFCLCLDGEMFCWWQDCPPATDGPCKDQGPFSQCDNIVATKASLQIKKQDNIKNSTSDSKPEISNNKGASESNFNVIQSSTDDNMSFSSSEKLGKSVENISSSSGETSSSMVTSPPKYCTVMGIQYRIGDKLPHDTGNCIECICDLGAKITCSPHQCTPLGEEMNDYRPAEPRLSNPENF